MIAGIEHLSGVIRVWQDGRKYGEPYEWCASVRYITRDTIEILGYTTKVTPSIWKAVITECQRLGIKKIIGVSYRDGQRREKHITVPSKFQQFYR